MIRCLPQGFCSWDYVLRGDGRAATIEFNWTSEQGAILIDGTRFEVRKHGFLSGQWTLEHEGIAAASAQKSNPFTRTFEVRAAGDDFVLRAQSAMGRTFLVERGERTVATIAPEHPFTRRARIECQSDECDFVTLCFLFWLAAITWRRAAQSNS